jgi:hypothetical protein
LYSFSDVRSRVGNRGNMKREKRGKRGNVTEKERKREDKEKI